MTFETVINTELSIYEIALRVALAMLFGFIIGYDRERKNKPIDFRAYMIVAVTSCMIAIVGTEIPSDIEQGKVIAGVLTGIGFLGAGCILRQDGKQVIGTATGASVWAAGGMGLALGYGFYALSLVMIASLSVILIGGGLYMEKFHDTEDKVDVDDDDKNA